MAVISKVFPQDFDRVYPLLQKFENSDFSKEKWSKLFYLDWPAVEENVGYMLIDNENVVGYLGCLYSFRVIHGRTEKVCNLSSWIVLPEYRSQSILLFSELLKNKELTVSSFTSTPSAIRILNRIGFEVLDNSYYFFPNKKFLRPSFLNYFTETAGIIDCLKDDDQRIYSHHKNFGLRHYVFSDTKQYCYTIFRVRVISLRKMISNAYINYIDFILRKIFKWSFLDKKSKVAYLVYTNDLSFFNNKINKIHYAVSKDLSVNGLLVDSRFCLKGKSLFRFRSCPQTSLFVSNHLKPEDVDCLYSELLIMGML